MKVVRACALSEIASQMFRSFGDDSPPIPRSDRSAPFRVIDATFGAVATLVRSVSGALLWSPLGHDRIIASRAIS